MRVLLLGIVVMLAMTQAEARTCELPDRPTGSFAPQVPPRNFFLCLLAEIEDLKKRQAELERIVPEYKRLAAELPTHFSNEDGKITYEEGRLIGSAGFLLSARQLGGSASMELDERVIETLCGAPNGCAVTLTFRKFGFRGDEALETQRVGPCQFEIDADTGCWVCGAGCGSDVSLEGIDGDGDARAQGSGASIVMEAGPGCLVADSDMRRTPGGREQAFEPDRRRGLYLVADPGRREDGASRFQCDLQLE